MADGLDQNVKKDEHSLTNDHADTEALLKNVVPADMLHFHGWGGAGILSIGTFGLKDDFSITEHKKDYFSLIGKEQDMESEDEQSNDDDDDGDDGRNDDSNSDKEDYEEEWNPLVYDKSGAPRPNAIVMNVIDTKLLSPNNLLLDLQDYSYSRNNYHRHKNNDNKKERITLADLFSADSDDEHYGATKKPNYGKTQCSKKPAPDCGAAKNATSFAAKKFIPRVKEDSRPIQKLHGVSNLLFFPFFPVTDCWVKNSAATCKIRMVHLSVWRSFSLWHITRAFS